MKAENMIYILLSQTPLVLLDKEDFSRYKRQAKS